MSIDVPESYVDQFSTNVHMLAEQRQSRLLPAVMSEDVVAESFSRERVGTTQDGPNEVTQLHGDTPLNNTPNSKRWGFIKDFDVADLIDKQSQVKQLIDLNSPYTIKHAGVMGRGIDTTIIDALGGSATEGKGKGTTVALPSAQTIASGSTGLTVDKLLTTKEILDGNEVDEFDQRFFVASAKQISDLLNDTKVTSSDFNTVKALVQGQVNEFMGFTFLRSERLPKSGNDRECFAFTRMSILVGFAQRVRSLQAERPDKRHARQIYTYGSWGAMRVEDERVVSVDCDES